MYDVQGSRFARLLELARTNSSNERRDLLRAVTDLFFDTGGTKSERERELFDDVLSSVAAEMQDGVLVELAKRFANVPDAPVQLMRDLANHALPVAEPILRHSPALSDEDLVRVVKGRSAEHVRVVALRPKVSARVTEAIVEHGDDIALDGLVRNIGAAFSRKALEQVVDRARTNKALHEGVVSRADMPLDLLNEMYFVVEQRLRSAILTRNASVDPATLDAALEKTRSRLQRSAAESTEDNRRAQLFITQKRDAGLLTPSLLISLYRDKQFAYFMYGLAELTGLDHETTRQIILRRDIDALATICRAADMERPLFVTIAVLACGGEKAMAQAEEFGRLYTAVPRDAARRAMRFYRVRKVGEEAPVAA
jgi:uncharacterized protein (DUF2336 family)